MTFQNIVDWVKVISLYAILGGCLMLPLAVFLGL